MRELLLSMFIVILLAGCARHKAYYDRPGATPAMFDKESAECKSWAHKAAAMKSGTYTSFGREPGHGGAEGLQANEDQYYREYNECLKLKGWKQVPKPLH